MYSYNSVPPPDQGSQVAVQPIHANEAYLTRLHALTSSTRELVKSGYRLTQLTEQELALKARCACCQKTIKPPREKTVSAQEVQRIKFGASPMGQDRQPNVNTFIAPSTSQMQGPTSVNQANQAKSVCIYHSGRFDRNTRTLTCCHKGGGAPGCVKSPTHTSVPYRPGELRQLWTFHPTSKSHVSPQHRAAVAIDCEMGTSTTGESELIRVSLIDYFSGSTLLDSLVWPDIPMAHFNTRFSGVTAKAMHDAHNRRQCIAGRDEARRACQAFVGPNTIVIGHSAQNDLTALRWAHELVLDTYLIEAKRIKREEGEAAAAEEQRMVDAIDQGDEGGFIPVPAITAPSTQGQSQQQHQKRKTPKGTGRLALKTLTRERLGRDIQTKQQLGHDSLEDAVAARDLAHWFVLNHVFVDDVEDGYGGADAAEPIAQSGY